jgi:predicted RNase H-like nuclease (RuvC/YqgF family)
VPTLWDRLRPSRLEAKVHELEATVIELGVRIDKTGDHIEELAEGRDALKDDLDDRGHREFEALTQDADAYYLLKELAEVEQLLEQAKTRLAAMRRLRERAQSAARRLGRIVDAESATGVKVDESEITQILEEARAEPADAGPATVEEHVERQRLKELFESEF